MYEQILVWSSKAYLNDNSGCLLDVDECFPTNNCDQLCVDGIGMYTCSCRTGFRLLADTISCLRKY